jgi:periplasmic copper chaperone A
MKKTMLLLMFMLLSRTTLAADLTVTDPWVRLVPPVAHASAAYLTLHNDTAADASVIAVTSDAADKSDLHGTRMQDGKMVMYHLDSVVVPAHGQFSFAPGGAHIMLMGLKRPLKAGQHVNIVLHLADGDSIQVAAPVRDMRGQMTPMH